ncbi:MAG TPA: RNA methyltransferase substrate-binding domain-containing protein, partial [Acidimicrobiales bacterium]|nr:RNA methyltransferase substrate-binding domain-containing protein [Acidimicrobiales bacterium]
MKDGGGPDGLGGEQVEGHHAVHELLAAGRRRTHRVWVVSAHSASDSIAPLVQLAHDRGVQVLVKAVDDLMQVARTGAP